MNPDLRVLVVSPRQCWPARSGAKLRDYHLAKALGSRSKLTYVYYSDPGLEPIATGELPFAASIVSVPRPRGYSPLKLMRGLLSPWPLTVVNYHSHPMARALESLLREPFDLVQFDATHLAPFAPLVRRLCPGAQIAFDWHNIESELLLRYAESSASALRRFYARVTARKMASLERELLRSDAWHLVCSEREQAQLNAISPHSRIAVIGNGVDAEYYAPSPESERDFPGKTRLLFVGLMSYHANIEAAIWFTREVWPGIRARFPQWTLTLAGADPVPAVVELRTVPGVEVTGTVPDLRPFYRDAFAVIVPLLTGAGTRLKILEAMAAGVPVISTPLGAEGLAARPGQDLLIADEAGEWLTHLTLLTEPEIRDRLLDRASRLIRERYDWLTIGNSLFEIYTRWFQERGENLDAPPTSEPLLEHPQEFRP